MQKSRAGPLALLGFLCLGRIHFSDDFREHCAKLPARIPKNSENYLHYDMKKDLVDPFLQGVQLSPS